MSVGSGHTCTQAWAAAANAAYANARRFGRSSSATGTTQSGLGWSGASSASATTGCPVVARVQATAFALMMTAAALGVAFSALGAVAALPTRRCPRLDQAPELAHTAAGLGGEPA